MRGSLRKRGDSWQLRVYLGVDPATGKKAYCSRSIRGTKREAERELTKMVREIDTGSFVVPERITLGAYLQRWLKDAIPASSRAERTQQAYGSIVTRHLIPALGHVPLQRLTPAMVEHYYATKRQSGAIGSSNRAK